MAYLLLVSLGGRQLRFPLSEGENTIGSTSECAIQIAHPTISRRHATVEYCESSLVLKDLGSSNGTHVAGRLISNPTELKVGSVFQLGGVEAVVETVVSEDLELAVAVPQSASVGSASLPALSGAESTVAFQVIEHFALTRLPELLDRLADGAPTATIARAVGAALFESLPCREVEVVDRSGGGDGVLFTAARGEANNGAEVAVAAGDGLVLRVSFLSRSFAEAYQPVVRSTAALIRAAGRSSGRVLESCDDPSLSAPRPQPPTVVRLVREVYDDAERIARGRVSVLIRGESGTGKELLARFIHRASKRAQAPLVTLNCAALPRDLLEAELFGVERGVATGVDARAGKFESAHGGTIFLDEIGDMAMETQARILRVLQEAEVYRLGGHQARAADVRVISATNRNLDDMLIDGSFRSDLYHRIADWVVELPPLRRRRHDVANLAAHFLGRASADRGVRVRGISRAAADALARYSWPGNIRQLEKEMARAALFLEDGDLLDTARLQPHIVESLEEGPSLALKDVLEHAEREHVIEVLRTCDGVVAEAANHLGLGLSTLYKRMKALGVTTQVVESKD